MGEENRLFINTPVEDMIESIIEDKSRTSRHAEIMLYLGCCVKPFEDRAFIFVLGRFLKVRRRPIFAAPCGTTIVGAEAFHYLVRNG